MPWSIRMIGKPENLIKELETIDATWDAAGQAEYREAKPHLAALIGLNMSDPPTAVKVDANGHAITKSGTKTYGTLNVHIEALGAKII